MRTLFFPKGLNEREKKAYRLHLISEMLDAFSVGAISLTEFVFFKSLDGSPYLVGVLFQASVIVMLFSAVFNSLILRTENKKRLYLISNWVTKMPLFLLILFTGASRGSLFFHYFFIGIYLSYSMTKPMMMPMINMFIKQNYTGKNFGSLYSTVATVKKIVVVISVFTIGQLLDFDNFSFRYIYPAVAVLSIISGYVFLMIPYEHNAPVVRKSFIKSVTGSFSNMFEVLRTNKPYRDFEAGFLFYGFAFMAATPVMTIFFNDALGLNYSSVAFYKNQGMLLSLLILPFMGTYIDKTDPRKFAIFTFIALMMFFVFIGITDVWRAHFVLGNLQLYYSLLIAHLFQAVFFAMMLLLWNIGSSYFCRGEDVSTYQSVHITLTGARGAIAPLVGIGIFKSIGYMNTFLLSSFLIIFSIIILFRSMKKYPDHNGHLKFDIKPENA